MMSLEVVTRSNLRQRVLATIDKLNLYDDEESLPLHVDQILATRIYIALLAVSLCIILLYTSVSIQTQIVTVSSPSLTAFERLSMRYSSTISCPCSRSTNSYGKFVTFDPEYHQVCSSGFVNNEWISSLFSIATSNSHPLDYRLIASSQFQVLTSLCRMAKQSISDALQQFLSSQMTSTETLFPIVFHLQVAAQVEQLQATTIADVQRLDRLLNLFIAQNRLISALRSNFLMTGIPESNSFTGYSVIYPNNSQLTKNSSIPMQSDDNCSCENTFKCTFLSGFYNELHSIVPDGRLWSDQVPLFIIPGMKVGCTPRDSILQSTLECFFDQKCLDIVVNFTGIHVAPSPLNEIRNNLSRFPPNTTLYIVFAQLMIESLHNTSNFDDYFLACAPQLCTYSYLRRFNLVYIVTTLISLIGGLTVIIRIVSPGLVQLIIRKIQKYLLERHQPRPPIHHPRLNLQERLTALLIVIREKIMTFNLFKNRLADIQHGIRSTRVYIILLVVGVVILTIYSSISLQTYTVNVENPTLEDYEDLYNRFSTKLTCPCQRLSMIYSSMMTVSPRYHQVCSSAFVQNEDWLKYWSSNLNMSDFYLAGQPFFSVLRTVCEIASTTISDTVNIFNSSQLVSTRALSRDYFGDITSLRWLSLHLQTINSFYALFLSLRIIMQNNQFLVYGSINAKPITGFVDDLWSLRYISAEYQSNEMSCSCDVLFDCYIPQEFPSQSLSNEIIPGLVVGCFPLQSFIFSTLECLYNDTCIQMLIDWRSFDNVDLHSSIESMNITALDSTISSTFNSTMLIDEIFSRYLFVDEWIIHTNYASYYSQCQPYVCTYTYTERPQVIYIITRVIGLLGGLTILFRLLVPSSVKLLVWNYHRFSHRHLPENDIPRPGLLRSLEIFIRQNLVTLNVYETKPATTVNPILATRIYLILLMLSIIIVPIFTGLEQQTLASSVQSPNESEFDSLHRQYSSTLSCPCSQNIIPYIEFVDISYALHQICSHPWITSYQLSVLMQAKGNIWTDSDWFIVSAQFSLLSGMCQTVQFLFQIFTTDLATDNIVSIETLSRKTFEDEMNSTTELFTEEKRTTFQRQLWFILDAFRSNQIQDRYMSNWKTEFSNQTENDVLRTIPLFFNNNTCTCAAGLSNCSRPLIFKDSNSNPTTLSGFIGGCSIMDGLRQSTLQCLSDQICLDELATLLNLPPSIPVLNTSVSTRFPLNTISVGTIIDELFIESWIIPSNYSKYFAFCAPSTCHYSYVERSNIAHILTTLLGLYGGLTVALQLIVWYSLYLLSMIMDYRRQRRQIVP